jgi:hypothetical protein
MFQRLLLFIGGVGIVVSSFFGTLWAYDRYWGSCPAGKTLDLARPFSGSPAGAAFTKEGLSVSGDTPAAAISTFVLCEGNLLLGPAHSDHAAIWTGGHGRFSHWGNIIVFSASDNSDPNTNGRTYKMVQPQ